MPTVQNLTFEYINNHRSFLVVYIIYICIVPLKEILMPHLFGKIINCFKAAQSTDLMNAVFLTIVLWIVIQIITFFIDWQDMYYYPEMMSFIRTKIIDSLFESYSTNYNEMKTVDAISKMSKLPPVIYGILDIWKKIFIPIVITFILAIVYISSYDLYLGIALVAITALYVYLIITSPKACGDLSQQKDHSYNVLNEETDDVLRNMMAVLNCRKEDAEITRLLEFDQLYAKLCRNTIVCIIKLQGVLVPSQIAFVVFSIYRCYSLSKSNKIDIGKVFTILMILLFLSNSMGKLTSEVKDVVIKYGVMKESMTIFEPELSTNRTYSSFSDVPIKRVAESETESAILSIENVSFKFDESLTDVLKNISISIKKGDKVLIEGRIGTGKSTLLKLIMKYKSLSSGMIFLDGAPYSSLTATNIRTRISYVPQISTLFNRTIYENIIYGSDAIKYPVDDVNNILEKLGLSHIFNNTQKGILSSVGKGGSMLSGGQRQIVWLLRVLLQEPDILLLDEPTANIDDETKKHVYDLLDRLMHNRTVVMVVHDKTLRARATRIINIDELMTHNYT